MLELWMISICIVLLITLIALTLRARSGAGTSAQLTEQIIRNELQLNRQEQNLQTKLLREELASQLDRFTQTFLLQQQQLRQSLENNLMQVATQSTQSAKEQREEQNSQALRLGNSLQQALQDYRERIREQFNWFAEQQNTLHRQMREQQDQIKESMERSISQMQQSNEQKLEEMRKTVDEKLEQTLQTRLSQSFSMVSERLEFVHKGLGEMQQLAIGVGDLKRVLTNVKTRGTFGEMQLSNILQQLLAPEQYEVNCITKPGSSFRVEFAIKIPQVQSDEGPLLMPVDSKFPIEDYYSLLAAYDANDSAAADAAGKALEQAIKKSARDIREKYIDPPHTTDIALLFVPIEGLYAELTRRPALMELLQREYQVIITGPTTFSAILHTVSFGYKTMVLEQRSGEIKKTLGAVKTEFAKFGDALQKAQERISKAGEDIDELVGRRTRQINRQLRNLEALPEEEARKRIDGELSE